MAESDRPVRTLLGIGGGIAAYKTVQVASTLSQSGQQVYVAMTRSAQQFVGPVSFAGVTGRRVVTDMFAPPSTDEPESIYPHLYPATEADAFVVLPATANLIGKLAAGIADDVVTTAALSLPKECRRYFCPAMNVEMWNQPIVQDNVHRLESHGWERIGPEAGHLACGSLGSGRMTEPTDIVSRILSDAAELPVLAGKRVMILSGPTVEHLDPVRFISNHSSGKMGRALAEAAVRSGAVVDFVTGPVQPVNLPAMPGIAIHPVEGASNMLAQATALFDQVDAVIFVAAVADYQVVGQHDQKLPKHTEAFDVRLEPTPDIAATLGAGKHDGQVLIGFALETIDGVPKARAKLANKHLDAIVLNGVDSMGAENGHFTWIDGPGDAQLNVWGRLEKPACAKRIIAGLAALLG